MVMTLERIMQQPYMKGAFVTAGEKYMSNSVQGVTFLNDAKSNNFVKNTIVFATECDFEMMGSNEQKACFEKLKNNKIAALIIKLEEGDCVKFDEPDSIGFPVVFLKKDVLLPSVIRGINYDIVYAQGYSFDRRYEDNLLQDLIFAEQDVHGLLRRIRMMGIRMNEYLCVFLVNVVGESDLEALMECCRECLGNQGFINCRNQTVMLLVRSILDFGEAKQQFYSFSQILREHLKKHYSNSRVVIGMGHTYENQAEIRKSYLSAKTALLSGLSFEGKEVIVYDEMGLYKILYSLKNRKELFELKNETVDVIREYDEKNNTEYYETIKTYVENFFSVQNSAKKLFVQYNTIRYRISKIKEVFGWDLFDCDDCISLSIGIQAEKFLQTEQLF